MKQIIEGFMQLNRLQQLIMLASTVEAQIMANHQNNMEDADNLYHLSEYMEVIVGYKKIQHVDSENLLFNLFPIK